MCKRRGVSKSMFTCFLTEKRHPICHELCDVRNREGGAFSENATEQGVFLEGQILQLWNQVGGGSFLMKYCWSREIYRFSEQQFFNANFLWNQDEVSQNSRYAKRFYYSRYLSAQTMQHFVDSGHSFAKIAIPCTILPLAQFTCHLGNQRCSAE